MSCTKRNNSMKNLNKKLLTITGIAAAILVAVFVHPFAAIVLSFATLAAIANNNTL